MPGQGKGFSAVFQAVAITAAQDLLSLLATSTTPLELTYVEIGQSSDFGDAAAENLRIRIRRGMTTVGSGGTAPAMNALNPRETLAAATATARANDTTAASGGTIVEMYEGIWNVAVPFIWMPPPELRDVCDISTRIAVNLVSTPADSLTVSGVIKWREL
jgi:hypothetical protein